MPGTNLQLPNTGNDSWLKKWFPTGCLLLLIVVYLSHLGFTSLDTENDEARRAIVSLEMMLRGDYISPTINGTAYLNKPPLYNWIIILFFKLTGSHSMFVFRLPVIISVVLLGYTVYFFVRKYTSKSIALLTAFTFMTNGRTLINDSLMGLIDTSFSLLVYLNFMIIYYFGQKKQYYLLFICSYLLTALAFLMKALPAIAFQGITLLVYFCFFDKFKKLFSLPHIAGGLVLLLILGSYYAVYLHQSHLSLSAVFGNLLHESTKRTVMEKGWALTIQRFILFPPTFIYHFLPWSVFVLAFVNKKVKVKQYITEHPFIWYNALVFFFNILVYWTSPEVIARYLFMFVPLFFTVIYYVLFKEPGSWQQRTLSVIIFAVVCVMLAATIATFFIPACTSIPHAFWKSAILVIAFGLLVAAMLYYRQYRYYLFIPAVLVFRMTFNWFIIAQPERFTKPALAAATGRHIADIAQSHPLYILPDAGVGNFDGLSFHISDRRQQLLTYHAFTDTGAYYIADRNQLSQLPPHITCFSFTNDSPDSLYVVKYPK